MFLPSCASETPRRAVGYPNPGHGSRNGVAVFCFRDAPLRLHATCSFAGTTTFCLLYVPSWPSGALVRREPG